VGGVAAVEGGAARVRSGLSRFASPAESGSDRAVISVVIPTLNAAPTLAGALAPLVAGAVKGVVKEVVVADGGSGDATLEIAEEAGCRIVRSARGRGTQLRAGCAAAKADWLLALHADTRLSEGWIGAVRTHVAAGEWTAGYFGLAFDDLSWTARLFEAGAAARCRLLGLPYGDQGLLISRRLYEAVGGYAEQPLFEDAEMAKRLGRARLRPLAAKAVTSAERYRREGWWRRWAHNQALLLRWKLGADPAALARAYGRERKD